MSVGQTQNTALSFVGDGTLNSSLGSVPNIFTDFAAWKQWRANAVIKYERHCPSRRRTTYFFSQAGDDSANTGTSPASPWKTLAKASAVIAASEGNVRCRFKRGDTWREATGLSITKDNITLDAYGSGNKPVFDKFTVQHTSGWSLAAGNRYTKTEANDVAWVKNNADPLGIAAGTTLIRVASSAACEALSNSFYWDSGGTTLHLNLGGTDPNTLTIDVCPSNSLSGVEFQGDGCRVEDIVGYGWGCHRTTTATQEQPFTNRNAGRKANLFKRVEGYYSGSHCMAHHQSGGSSVNGGGHSMWLECKGGLAKYNASGVTIFNSYSAYGNQETWFIGCEATFGQLKSSDWTYASGAVAGIGFYGHADNTQNIGLFVCDQCSMAASHSGIQKISGCGDVPTFNFADPTTCRAFTTRCTMVPVTASGSGSETYMPIHKGIVYGNDFQFRPVTGGIQALTNLDPTTTMFVQNRFVLDMDNVGNNSFGLYNTSVTGGGIGGAWYHNWIRLYNCEGTSGANGRFGIDYDVLNNTGAVPSGTSQVARCANNVVSCEMSTGSSSYYGLGLNNIAAQTLNNAYYGLDASNTGRGGYSNDAGKVSLGSAPSWNVVVAGLQSAGTADMDGSGLRLSHDFYGKARRTSGVPDIGPVEF